MNIDKQLDEILLTLYLGDSNEMRSQRHQIEINPMLIKAKSALKKLIVEARHEQRHQALGVSRWISVGGEHGYWEHPMTLKKARSLREGKDI